MESGHLRCRATCAHAKGYFTCLSSTLISLSVSFFFFFWINSLESLSVVFLKHFKSL